MYRGTDSHLTELVRLANNMIQNYAKPFKRSTCRRKKKIKKVRGTGWEMGQIVIKSIHMNMFL